MDLKTPRQEKEFLTRAEVCDLLGIGPTKLWMLTSSGELPVVRIGRSVRVAKADFDEFVRRNRSAAAAH
jgi:excisionase family DNA binding protein